MSGGGVVEVEGARELRRTLKAIGADLDDLKTIHDAVATVVVNAARPRTPQRSGRLAASVRGTGARTVATIRAGFARVPYANPIHWGWYRRGIRPNPFLTETASATEPVWTTLYSVGVQGLIDVDIQKYARTTP